MAGVTVVLAVAAWLPCVCGVSEPLFVPRRPPSITPTTSALYYLWEHEDSVGAKPTNRNEPRVRTLLSPTFFATNNLVPQDSINPLYTLDYTYLLSQLLLNHMLEGKVDLDDPRLSSPQGVRLLNMAFIPVVLKREDTGTLTVNSVPVTSVQMLDDGLLVLEIDSFLFDFKARVRTAWKQLAKTAPASSGLASF